MDRIAAPASAESLGDLIDRVPAATPAAESLTGDQAEELTAAESLIEEVSIDGMCGVY